jgi:hypothetical protein
MSQKFELPRRVPGGNLPPEAARLPAVGRAQVRYPADIGRWVSDEPSLRILLNGLRRWMP